MPITDDEFDRLMAQLQAAVPTGGQPSRPELGPSPSIGYLQMRPEMQSWRQSDNIEDLRGLSMRGQFNRGIVAGPSTPPERMPSYTDPSAAPGMMEFLRTNEGRARLRAYLDQKMTQAYKPSVLEDAGYVLGDEGPPVRWRNGRPVE